MIKHEYIEYEMEDYQKVWDEMTDEEIINILQFLKRGCIPDYDYAGDEADFEHYKYHMAILKAIEIIKNRM